jgi:hypothetical protein
MKVYYYQVIYQDRRNGEINRCLIQVKSRQDDYENALISNAVQNFCISVNGDKWSGDYVILSVSFVKKVMTNGA